MRQIIFFLFMVSVLFACKEASNTQASPGSLSRQLVGEWNNLSIKVDIRSKSNSDSNEVIEVNRPEWEERLKIKPIRSFFREDSTWNSAHYNLKDSLVYNPSGKWWVKGDELIMLQLSPSPDTTRYSLIVRKDTASFEALLDWDMDGKKDDTYFGKQVKVDEQK